MEENYHKQIKLFLNKYFDQWNHKENIIVHICEETNFIFISNQHAKNMEDVQGIPSHVFAKFRILKKK